MLNLIVVSNSKKSFKEESKILDKYAIRISRNVWRLNAHEKTFKILVSQLKNISSKNTQIIFLKKNKKFLTIGNSDKFYIKKKNKKRELSEIVATWHDLGKKSLIFQEMITKNNDYTEYFIRHEYLSVLYIEYFIIKNNLISKENYKESFINKDLSLIKEFIDYVKYRVEIYNHFSIFKEDSAIFDFLFLIGTHHKLPLLEDNISTNSIYIKKDREFVYEKTNISLSKYLKEKLEKDIDILNKQYSLDFNNLIQQRLSILLADANGSSMKLQKKLTLKQIQKKYEAKEKAKDFKKTEIPEKNQFQTYDEHIKAVTFYSKKIKALLNTKPFNNWIYDNKDFVYEKTDLNKFKWQRESIDFIDKNINTDIPTLTFLGSSTGSGKTRFGLKLHNLISKRKRLTVLNGLVTLTLQTGSAYKEIGILNDNEITILIGQREVKKIYDTETEEIDKSIFEDLSDFDSRRKKDKTLLRYFESDFLNINKEKFLNSPVLICTLDYIFQAVKLNKQKHIFPILRISSSDILIDEIDNFDINGQKALLNLVFLIGLYGSNLTISSATIYPELAESIYEAYKNGLNAKGGKYFNTFYISDFENYSLKNESFSNFFKKIGSNRTYLLKNKIEIIDMSIEDIIPRSIELHDNEHETFNDKEYSVGLVKINNIKYIKRAIFSIIDKIKKYKDINFEIICYHSQLTLIERSFLEKKLDTLLTRKSEFLHEKECFKNKNLKKKNIIIVVASPVEEVGRDHDFDWIIQESASVGSMIQGNGRVFRHRPRNSDKTNIYILNKNFRLQDLEFEGKQGLCYLRPGLETKEIEFSVENDKSLKALIKEEDIQFLQTNKLIYDSKKNTFPFFERLTLKKNLNPENIIGKKNQLKFYLSDNSEFIKRELRSKSKTAKGYIDQKGDIYVDSPKNGFTKIEKEVIDIYVGKVNNFFNSTEFYEFKEKYIKTEEDCLKYNSFVIPYYKEGIPKKILITKNVLIEGE